MRDSQRKAEALAARARALETKVMKAKKVSAAQRHAFDRLIADVKAYNTATGRFDVSVERATFTTAPAHRPAYSSRMIDTGEPFCTVDCPFFPPNRPDGYFCLPDGESFCDPDTGNTVCSYRCVKIPLYDELTSKQKPGRPPKAR